MDTRKEVRDLCDARDKEEGSGAHVDYRGSVLHVASADI